MELNKVLKAVQEIENDRSISKEIIMDALEEALTKAYRKHIDIQDVQVRVSFDNNTITVYHQWLVVEEVEDDELEISLEDARSIRDSFELGDFVEKEVDISEFGRLAIILAKNVMKQKTREAQKQAVYDEYSDKLEEMVTGIVETVEEKFCLVNIGKTLALMPKVAQIPNEEYYEDQSIKVVISDVNKDTKGAQVLVSRADPVLVKRLFEKEVPEIFQGIVEIKAIARDPGERCKMAVYSHNENIDPIGACIGPKGARVQIIIDELKGEKIDIFEWSEDAGKLIKNALAPADILAVIPNPLKRGLMVIVRDDQLSLAIGKKGKNARLAVKLTNNTIDIKSVSAAKELNIDWETIAQNEADRILEEKAAEREKAQKVIFDELQKQEIEHAFSEELFDEDVIEEEFIKNETAIETNDVAEELIAELVEETVVEAAEDVAMEEDELEKAARLVREKKKQAIDIEEKRAYVSKFEQIAGSRKEEAEKQPKFKKKYKKQQDDDEIIFNQDDVKPTFDPNERNYELKPIYTDEELAEIEAAEAQELEKEWINDDIDFDEYDEYYDEE